MGNSEFVVWHVTDLGTVEAMVIAAENLADAAQLLPGGVYTTLRTYQGDKVLRLKEHFKRMAESAGLMGSRLRIDDQALKDILRVAIYEKPHFSNKRLRIHMDTTRRIGEIYVLAEELHTPSPAEYIHGVAALTRLMHRETARAKSTAFIKTANEIRADLELGVNEALMLGEGGEILEGLSSNFFAVINQKLWTAEVGVLHGITRGMVLDVCTNHNIEVVKNAVTYENHLSVTEAFITSASRGVLPLTILDGQPIGNGKPGRMTHEIASAYEALILKELEIV